MTETHLPQHVIEEDHSLERATESATESLAQLRWHWTLDESNPARVTAVVYARDTNRHVSVVALYAKGYRNWLALEGALETMTISEAVNRARFDGEKQTVVAAIADARGISFATAERHHRDTVQRVRDVARQRAEEKGTTVEEEAPAIAKMMARVSQRDVEVRDERNARHGLRYIELEGYLVNMLRYGKKAAELAAQMHVEPEEQTLLQHTIDQVRRMLHVIDERIAGIDTVDWDAELAAIMEGVA